MDDETHTCVGHPPPGGSPVKRYGCARADRPVTRHPNFERISTSNASM
jgi:hypothetical protein